MKVTFLGTGSAYGIPTCGGDWGACDPDNQKNRRMCQSLLIESGAARILIDMGPSFREQSIAYGVRDLDAILFTHAHYDHFAGLPELPSFVKWQTKPITLYAHRDTWAGIQKSIFWMFDDAIQIQYYGDQKPRNADFDYSVPFKIGDIEVLPILQNHGGFSSAGFRIGDFAYSTDLNSMPEQSWQALEGVKTWVLECDCVKPSKDHNHLQLAIEWINMVRPEKCYLTHLSITMDHDTVRRQLPEGADVAWDGLEIIV